MPPLRAAGIGAAALVAFLLVGSVFLGISSAGAQEAAVRWQDLGPQAGEIDQLAFDAANPRVIFAGGMDVGLYRSTDGGGNWSQDSPSQDFYVASLATSPNQPGSVYVTVAGKLYSSGDDGASWSLDTSCPGYSIKYYVSPVNPSTRYLLCSVGSVAGLMISSDNGTHWENANLGNAIVNLYDVAVSQATIYLLGNSYSNSELLRSNGGGDTWTNTTIDFDFSLHSPLAVSPTNSSVVLVGGIQSLYSSGDGGRTWKDVSDDPIQSVSRGFAAFDPKNGSVAYAGRVGLWKSVDSGRSFQQLGFPLGEIAPGSDSYHADPGAIALDDQLGAIYLGTDGGVFVSHDAGATWTWLPNGMRNGLVLAAAVDPANSQHIVVVRQDWGPTQTMNGGTLWQDLTRPFIEWGSVQFDPSNSSVVYVATGGGVWKSVNGGRNFSQTNAGLASVDQGFFPNAMQIRVNPLNHTELWLAAGNFYKSTDAGAHWQNVTITANEGRYPDVADVAPMGRVVYASYAPTNGTVGTIWRSENGGANWTELNLPAGFTFGRIAVDPSDPSVVFALGSWLATAAPAIYASYDLGDSFVPLALPPDGFGEPQLAVGGSASDLRIVLGTTEEGAHLNLFESIDRGDSWTSITSNLNVTTLTEVLMPPTYPDAVYVATFGSGIDFANISRSQLVANTTTTTTSPAPSTTSTIAATTSLTSTESSESTATSSALSASTLSSTMSSTEATMATSTSVSTSLRATTSPSSTSPAGGGQTPEEWLIVGAVVLAAILVGTIVVFNVTKSKRRDV